MGAKVTFHADRLANPVHRAFVLDFATRMGKRNQLRIFQLEIDGSVAGCQVGYVLGRELYMYFSGYDPAWAKYSLMTRLMAEVIKWATEQNFNLINLSTGKDLSKLRWKPEEIILSHHLQFASNMRGSLVRHAFGTVMHKRNLELKLGQLIHKTKQLVSR
jgi:CelD/BcsL family acetyltransferase involved in cellulose biosynthesis